MSADDETRRTSVRTYLPAYQKQRWAEQAEQLGMSQSEFVRVMVQAGRRGFTVDPVETDSDPSQPGSKGMKPRLEEILRDAGPMGWNELLDEIKVEIEDELEDRLETGLEKLQEADVVRYSGRDGGYVMTDE
ncbi:MAG: hypothetical protein A07HR60_02166 [uncultured archaeon A07HR60]|nr:MAG: hypothetical protein A07HR60_02166 [uncultured archaeon A07HR60]